MDWDVTPRAWFDKSKIDGEDELDRWNVVAVALCLRYGSRVEGRRELGGEENTVPSEMSGTGTAGGWAPGLGHTLGAAVHWLKTKSEPVHGMHQANQPPRTLPEMPKRRTLAFAALQEDASWMRDPEGDVRRSKYLTACPAGVRRRGICRWSLHRTVIGLSQW
ncbi:hypothetical protein EK21DRAFT_117623 [Setomelanomma holmii]|uniref:Uncharacterized protein n=1 Tax=Setomelanomma holmii TaxID=210430 RepID=A0A9P4GZ11_9PLEO|nr:hypothetical protein EK21DRAFT_117623 [Setomelanomma holmii]